MDTNSKTGEAGVPVKPSKARKAAVKSVRETPAADLIALGDVDLAGPDHEVHAKIAEMEAAEAAPVTVWEPVTPTMAEMVAHVQQMCHKFYSWGGGGCAYIVETHTDEEIAAFIGHARTLDGAWRKALEVAGRYNSQAKEVMNA